MAFLQEPKSQPFLRIPAATVGLLAALVVAHIARVQSSILTSQAIIANYAFFPTRYSHAYLVAHNVSPQSFWDRAIPFVSYSFLHLNSTHLAVNCVLLLPFGSVVARRLGAILFILLFLVCGIAGALTYLLARWGAPVYITGASAAISGIIAVGVRIMADVQARDVRSFAAAVSGDPSRQQGLAPVVSVRCLAWTGLFAGINALIVAINAYIGEQGTGPQVIAWQAHMGGYAAGMFLAGPCDALARRLRA